MEITNCGLKGTGAIFFLAAILAIQADAAVKDLNTPREFPQIASRNEWSERAQEIREQVLVSCGLWPMPKKSPLKAQVFDRVDRDGYTVEKVFFQTLPGFYLAGNLYRPLARGKGPFPAVLNPHGHWKEGRLVDNSSASIAARCIQFARQGMIAFSYDMVGYNDTFFAGQDKGESVDFSARHHSFATDKVCELYNVNLMGLQTWNSIRALDFLESLADVDSKRLACTGESGGGTQTFILGAIENRLSAQAPVVMVSHSMQGGCLCENAPGLRVEYSNMEIAAAAAPRAQILVGAAGDWTKTMLTVEGPGVEHIYELFKASDRLRYVRFDFDHNYNQTSREAVYAWFGKWLLKDSNESHFKETASRKEPDSGLRVWANEKLPDDAVSQEECIRGLIAEHKKQVEALLPAGKTALEQFRIKMFPAWRHTLQLSPTQEMPEVEWSGGAAKDRVASLGLKRADETSGFSAIYFPAHGGQETGHGRAKTVVLAGANGGEDYLDESGKPAGLAKRLAEANCGVLVIKTFSEGDNANPFANFFTTYNRTTVQRRVRDLAAACSAAREFGKASRAQVVLCGGGVAGLWSLLASPTGVDAIAADGDQLDLADDANLLAPDLFCPGIRNLGGFEGVALLGSTRSLLVHNAAASFSAETIRKGYGDGGNCRIEHGRLGEEEIAEWIVSLK